MRPSGIAPGVRRPVSSWPARWSGWPSSSSGPAPSRAKTTRPAWRFGTSRSVAQWWQEGHDSARADRHERDVWGPGGKPLEAFDTERTRCLYIHYLPE